MAKKQASKTRRKRSVSEGEGKEDIQKETRNGALWMKYGRQRERGREREKDHEPYPDSTGEFKKHNRLKQPQTLRAQPHNNTHNSHGSKHNIASNVHNTAHVQPCFR